MTSGATEPAEADGTPPLTILHVTAPAEVGGLERVVQALAVGHRRRGLRVEVAAVVPAPLADRHPFLTALRSVGVEALPISLPPRSYRRERAALTELYRTIRPDVVHTHGYRSDVLGGATARRHGLPVVSTVHGFTGGGWKNRVYEALQVRSLRRCSAIVAVAHPVAERLARSGVPAGRLHVVPNAYDPSEPAMDRAAARRALGVAQDAFHIGWVGRMSHEKGPDLMLETLAELGDLPVTLSMIGDGPMRAALMERATQLRLDGRVAWHGSLPGASQLFPAFDVFALSSRTEGTPIVAFEAMAAEVPIVATRAGGVPDVLSEEEARLVPISRPLALADAIREVWRRPADAAARARAARRRLEEVYTVAPWLERYEEVYRSLSGR